jgi:predicted alpha-1,2-mannosidase
MNFLTVLDMIRPTLLILAICLIMCFAIAETNKDTEDLTKFVDPMIGADYHGHVFVGANVPFGGVQVGPTNFYRGWDWCSGYHYSDSIVRGFSQLHLSGTGIGDLGDILVMPATGVRITEVGTVEDISDGYASKYRHQTEEVSPGYYKVELEKYKIKVELTATERVAFHRYTFPESKDARIIIDLGEGIGRTEKAVKTYLNQINETTFEGYRYSSGWAKDQREFFTLVLNKPVKRLTLFCDGKEVNGHEAEGTIVKGFLEFETIKDEVVLMKIGLSPISMSGALKNLNLEAADWNFDLVWDNARDKWRKALSRIRIKTNDVAKKRTFYTAMYHSMFAPNLFCDADGSYRGADFKIYPNPGYQTYTVFSLWDTYRAAHPLFTLTAPERVGDMVNTLLSIYKEQGKLPVWHLRGAETNCMVGYSAVPVVVDACLKGFTGIDINLAYEAVKTTATGDFEPGIKDIMELGYIPADKMKESVARAMEYAISDWGIAQLAKKLGKNEDYSYFIKRSNAFMTYFDKETKFMRGILKNGQWRTPFDPISAKHRDNDYCEGNAWQYIWLVPQNPEGLIDLMGGDKPFTERLDSLFSLSSELQEGSSADITGLIGQYAHGNEPSHATAYLYAYAGEQYKTAQRVHQINTEFYTDKKDGIVGNEDCGQMSAWYIFSSMGFYPVNSTSGMYVFGSPLFEEVILSLPENKSFVVKAKYVSDKNIYIKSVTLNGQPYDKSYVTHRDIVSGGELVFIMDSIPNKTFGLSKINRPESKLY